MAWGVATRRDAPLSVIEGNSAGHATGSAADGAFRRPAYDGPAGGNCHAVERARGSPGASGRISRSDSRRAAGGTADAASRRA